MFDNNTDDLLFEFLVNTGKIDELDESGKKNWKSFYDYRNKYETVLNNYEIEVKKDMKIKGKVSKKRREEFSKRLKNKIGNCYRYHNGMDLVIYTDMGIEKKYADTASAIENMNVDKYKCPTCFKILKEEEDEDGDPMYYCRLCNEYGELVGGVNPLQGFENLMGALGKGFTNYSLTEDISPVQQKVEQLMSRTEINYKPVLIRDLSRGKKRVKDVAPYILAHYYYELPATDPIKLYEFAETFGWKGISGKNQLMKKVNQIRETETVDVAVDFIEQYPECKSLYFSILDILKTENALPEGTNTLPTEDLAMMDWTLRSMNGERGQLKNKIVKEYKINAKKLTNIKGKWVRLGIIMRSQVPVFESKIDFMKCLQSLN